MHNTCLSNQQWKIHSFLSSIWDSHKIAFKCKRPLQACIGGLDTTMGEKYILSNAVDDTYSDEKKQWQIEALKQHVLPYPHVLQFSSKIIVIMWYQSCLLCKCNFGFLLWNWVELVTDLCLPPHEKATLQLPCYTIRGIHHLCCQYWSHIYTMITIAVLSGPVLEVVSCYFRWWLIIKEFNRLFLVVRLFTAFSLQFPRPENISKFIKI